MKYVKHFLIFLYTPHHDEIGETGIRGNISLRPGVRCPDITARLSHGETRKRPSTAPDQHRSWGRPTNPPGPEQPGPPGGVLGVGGSWIGHHMARSSAALYPAGMADLFAEPQARQDGAQCLQEGRLPARRQGRWAGERWRAPLGAGGCTSYKGSCG